MQRSASTNLMSLALSQRAVTPKGSHLSPQILSRDLNAACEISAVVCGPATMRTRDVTKLQ